MRGGRTIALRPASPDDVPFAFQVAQETMRDYAIATWGSWPEERARSGIEKHVLSGQTQIVELDGDRIGIEVVERTSEHIRLLQLFIRPTYQRQGIGSDLMQQLMHEARQARLPLKLRVLRVNPAQRFYERLGFTIVDTTAEHVHMRYAI